MAITAIIAFNVLLEIHGKLLQRIAKQIGVFGNIALIDFEGNIITMINFEEI